MIYKNPNLIYIPINDEYISCVNPSIKNWVKVISKAQYDFLSSINEPTDLKTISENLWCDINVTKKIISLFTPNNILNTTWKFDYEIMEEDVNPEILNLWIHTTDKCNLRCTYCNIKTKLSLKDMDYNTANELCVSIIETVKQNNLRGVRLRLSWWEPTIVYKKWIQLLQKLNFDLKKLGCSLGVSLLSNWTLINDETMQIIKDNHFWLSISLDGIWQYNQNRITVDWKNSFEKVKNSIETSLEKWITPNILTVVSSENMEWLPELTKYLISKNLPFRYSFVQGQELNQEKLIEIMEKCYSILESAIETWYQFTSLHRLCDLKFLNPWISTCSSGINWWAIYIDWWIYFCQTEFGDKKNELWNVKKDRDILKVIEKWSKKTWNISDDCNTCSYEHICTWWCPLERKDWKDVHCEIYKVLIPKFYRLIWKERLLEVLKKSNDS